MASRSNHGIGRIGRFALLALGLAFAALFAASPALAVQTQPSFSESVPISGLTEPTDIAFAPDGRVFIAEKSGLIKEYDNFSDTTATTVADLRTKVHNFWDRGLLSLTLDPNFPTRPYLYVLYTYDAAIGGTAPRWGVAGQTGDGCPDPPGATDGGCVVSGRVSKLTISGNTSTNEQVLVEDWCQQYPSHSIGTVTFGPDGALYVSGGDGASFTITDYGQYGRPQTNPCGDPPNGVGGDQQPPAAEGGALRSQDIRTPSDPTGLNGSIIRINPDTGAALPDNPMASSTDPNTRRIIAHGLRNPFRIAPRPGTSEIWVGDVGWETWEEIDRISSPTDSTVENFGWPCYEGAGRQPGYEGLGLTICQNLYNANPPPAATGPYYTYNHANPVVNGDNCAPGGSSISGLAFYGTGNYPAAYQNALFFSDYSRRCIWVMFPSGGTPSPSNRQLFARDIDPVDLEIGPGGDLFMVDFTGSIRRYSYSSGGNSPPTALAQGSPTNGPLPLTVNFDGTGSSDPDPGDTLSYSWDLDGNGTFGDSTAAKPSRTYTSAGQVNVGLRVTDSHSATDTDTLTIYPGNSAPQAVIDTPAASLTWKVGDTINFTGHGSDPDEGTLPASRLQWSLDLLHCTTVTDCHAHSLQSWSGVSGASFVAPDHDYPSHLELTLTVTDSAGVSASKTIALQPRTVDLSFQTNPTGLSLGVGADQQAAPFTRTVIVGSTNSISAPSPQNLGATPYRFVSWSDGGAGAHDIVAPSANATYTATYAVDTTPSGLVAAFGFNETSGATVTDSSPSANNGTISGTSAPTRTTAGRFGGALTFDGVNDWVTVPDANSLDLTNAMTVEAWVRPSAVTNWRTVLFKERPGAGHSYALYGSDGSRPNATIFNGSTYPEAFGTSLLPVNAWSHLAGTLSGGTLRIYLNGTQVGSVAASGTMPNGSGPLRIGGNAIWPEWFAGQIDEVRVYNRALSQNEINTDSTTAISPDTAAPSAPGGLTATGAIGRVTLNWSASTDNVGVTAYNVYRSTTAGFTPAPANRIAVVSSGTTYADSGLAAGNYYYRVTAVDAAGNESAPSAQAQGTATSDVTPPTVSITAPAGGAQVSGTINVQASASDNVGVAGVQFLLGGQSLGSEDTASPFDLSWDTRTVANGTYQLAARARDAAGNQSTSPAVSVVVNNSAQPSGLVAAFGFNETSGATVTDSSPSANNGTISGTSAPTRTTAGRFGGALTFDGVNDWVTVPDANSLDLTNAMTVEAWVRPSAVTNWRTVLFKERPGAGHSYALYGSDGSRPNATIFNGSTYPEAFGTSLLPVNAWSHLAGTLSGGTLRIYLNGTQVGSVAASGTMPNGSGPLRIGGNAIWPEWFAGQIDEVRVYNRALSQNEINTDSTTAITP